MIHYRQHTSFRPFVCAYPGCEKTFTSHMYRRRHYNRHRNPPKQESTEYTRQKKINKESPSVFSTKICLWPECGVLIDSKKTKKMHILKHSKSSSVLECLWPECIWANKLFKAPRYLRKHMQNHYLRLPFKCEVSLTV